MFTSEAWASAGGLGGQDIATTIIQLALIFLIFYLLLIKPQQKKMKQHNEMLLAIKIGDKVLTGGGIYGKVVKDNGGCLTVEIANSVEIVVSRMTIRDVVNDEPANDVKTAEKNQKNKK